MAKKRSRKQTKKSVRVVLKQLRRRARKRQRGGRLSFLVGAITVIILAFLLFQYAQSNNYKEVLGQKVKIEKQTPRFENLR